MSPRPPSPEDRRVSADHVQGEELRGQDEQYAEGRDVGVRDLLHLLLSQGEVQGPILCCQSKPETLSPLLRGVWISAGVYFKYDFQFQI